MRYRTTQPFIAFGKCCEPGDVVELTEEQAEALFEVDSITDYETKILPPPENKARKKKAKQSASAPAARQPRKRTRKN